MLGQGKVLYIRSSSFVAEGDPVIDVVFLCRWKSGEAIVADPDEVAAVHWMVASELVDHPEVAPWTRLSLELAGKARLELGW